MPQPSPASLPFRHHDHHRCIDRALTEAIALCKQRGVRLTRQRRRVLELVWATHQPIGAYELLAQMAADGDGRPAPPTIYRALAFLQQQQLIHRIEGMNAYLGCTQPAAPHTAQFLICDGCRQAAELCDAEINAALHQSGDQLNFAPQQIVVEIHGLCDRCRRTDDAEAAESTR